MVMAGYAENHPEDTYCHFNPSTCCIIKFQNVSWADWHGITPLDSMTEVVTVKNNNNDTSPNLGIDDDDYFLVSLEDATSSTSFIPQPNVNTPAASRHTTCSTQPALVIGTTLPQQQPSAQQILPAPPSITPAPITTGLTATINTPSLQPPVPPIPHQSVPVPSSPTLVPT